VLWCASGRRQHQIPTSPVCICSTYVLPVSSVCDLWVHIDSYVILRTRHHQRQIVLCSTTSDSECSALSSTTRPADTNPCFGCQHGRLLLLRAGRCLRSSTGQAAARFVFSARRCERITPLLRDLHWLWVPERIQFCLCILAFRYVNGSAPPYLAESVLQTADVEGHLHLRSSTTMTLVVPSVQRLLLVTVPFLSLHRGHGTAYHLPSELFHPSPPFATSEDTSV